MAAGLYHNDKQFIKRDIYLRAKNEDTDLMTVEETRLANLRQLIAESGGPAVAAERLEMSPSQLSQISGRNPTRNIGAGTARKIETAWGKPKGWLDVPNYSAQSANQNAPHYNVTKGPESVTAVPLISWVQAGNWCDAVDVLAPGDAYKIVHTTIKVGTRAYALRIVGDSMTNPNGSPSFPENTIVIIDPDRSPESGRYVVARQARENEATFKQLVRDGGKLYLKPLNPRYPILEMHEDAVICGVLVQAVMDF